MGEESSVSKAVQKIFPFSAFTATFSEREVMKSGVPKRLQFSENKGSHEILNYFYHNFYFPFISSHSAKLNTSAWMQ